MQYTDEEKNELNREKQTVTRTTNTMSAPEVVAVDYELDDTPFEYREGMTVHDILERARTHKKGLEDEQGRVQRMAKVAAVGDFFKALGGLAGGGYASPVQYQPSPYLTRAFSEIDRLRSDRNKADMYYDDLTRRTRQEDYNNQFKAYLQERDRKDKYGYQSAKSKADAQNKANLEAYKGSAEKITETFEDPTRWKQEQALRGRQIAVQESNSETSRLRAENAAKGKSDPVILTVKEGDKAHTITKSQAEKLVKRAKSELKDIIENPATSVHREIAKALANAEVDNPSLSQAVHMLRKYMPDDYGRYFKESKDAGGVITPLATQKRGTFLPKKPAEQSKKRFLLD